MFTNKVNMFYKILNYLNLIMKEVIWVEQRFPSRKKSQKLFIRKVWVLVQIKFYNNKGCGYFFAMNKNYSWILILEKSLLDQCKKRWDAIPGE